VDGTRRFLGRCTRRRCGITAAWWLCGSRGSIIIVSYVLAPSVPLPAVQAAGDLSGRNGHRLMQPYLLPRRALAGLPQCWQADIHTRDAAYHGVTSLSGKYGGRKNHNGLEGTSLAAFVAWRRYPAILVWLALLNETARLAGAHLPSSIVLPLLPPPSPQPERPAARCLCWTILFAIRGGDLPDAASPSLNCQTELRRTIVTV